MKTGLAEKMAYIGAGIGIALFVVFGLTYGALIGGIFGMSLAKTIVGSPIVPTIGMRLLVGVGMLSGVMVACLMFSLGGAAIGWLCGNAVEAVRHAGAKDLAHQKAVKH